VTGGAFSDRKGQILFIAARNIVYMRDRAMRNFTSEDISRVAFWNY